MKIINKFTDWYKNSCYHEFSKDLAVKNRLNPRIWHGNYVVLSFINKNIKNFIRSTKIKDYSVLDLGCGFKPYQGLFSDNIKYFGVDFLNKDCDLEFNLNNELKMDEKFDIITCFDVIEHINNNKSLLDTFDYNLKDEGYLLISSPFFFNIHGSPFDYYRFTRNYYEDFGLKNFKLLSIKSSNYFLSSFFIHLNNIIFYLPVPYQVKYPFYLVNNIVSMLLNASVSLLLRFTKNDKIKELVNGFCLEYFVVYKKINENRS